MNKNKNLEQVQRDILRSFLEILNIQQSKDEALMACLDIILLIDWLPIKPKAGIFLVNDTKKQLELRYSSKTFSKELLTLCSKINFGHCICGRAASTREIVFVDCVNADHDVRFDNMVPHGHYSVPFFDSKKNILGVLVLYVEHGHVSTTEEISFLKTIAFSLGSICYRFDQEEVERIIQKSVVAQTMVATLNHEINNPLTIAMSTLSKLQKVNYDPKDLNKIIESLNRIKMVVKKIDGIVNKKIFPTELYSDESSVEIIKINK